ncbi:MAG: YicC family protein [Ruminococcaceae bacterium]|nr:YicC family protein [Oscillospiraceae bacterium]
MVRSMTGFGRSQSSTNGRDITVEIKSVNHRYFDCSVRLPRIYSFLEEFIKTRVQERVSRGKIEIYISVDTSKEKTPVSVTVNEAVLASYLDAAKQISDRFGLQNDILVSRAMSFSDVLDVQKAEEDEEELKKDILEVLDLALDEYMAMCQREGKRLVDDITYRIDLIRSLVDKIEERSPKCVEEYRAKLEVRMQEVLANTMIDPQRILTEAAIFADKTAVTEEIVRLRSHLNQLSTMLSGGGAIGRKVDFLVQEFNREANTIGSKGNDLEIAQLVVDLKAEIEKIREQIQNIE